MGGSLAWRAGGRPKAELAWEPQRRNLGARIQRGSRCRVATVSEPESDSEHGAVAQLGARLNGIEEVRGSNPLSSTVVILALWLG